MEAPKLVEIVLGSADVARTADFYHAAFHAPANGSRADFSIAGTRFSIERRDALLRPAEGAPPYRLCFSAGRALDAIDVMERADRAGGETVRPARRALRGLHGHIADPDGRLWKINSPRRLTLLRLRATRDADRCAIVLGCRDLQRSRAFYEAVGLTVSRASRSVVEFDHDAGGCGLTLRGREDVERDAGLSPGIRRHPPATFRLEIDEPAAFDRIRGVASVAGGGRYAAWSVPERTGEFADPDGHVWSVRLRAA